MASLIMPENQREVRREDFIIWVEKYMKAKNQQYQYKGIDLWGARCGLVHRYSPISSLSESGECKQFKYHDRYGHEYNPSVDENLVSISAPDFIHDFYKAMQIFLKDVLSDEELERRAVRGYKKFIHVISNKKHSIQKQ